MPLKQLDNLVRTKGGLKAEAPSRSEFEGLLRSGIARLKDAANTSLSPDSRFDLAYNAAHALSLAALRWHGYRSDNRYLVFQCLVHTLDLPNDKWRVLDRAHTLRNAAEYAGEVELDSDTLEALIRVTNEVLRCVQRLKSPPG